MFSGIIESMARVVAIEHEQDNVHLTLTCPFVEELSIDQSIAHNGVCLT
ncbi:MAG: riboflavin synthase, partial [Bacteroidaceae bacterium]|nr:riboflavin synthase [Bacteroidaceae bacterium]